MTLHDATIRFLILKFMEAAIRRWSKKAWQREKWLYHQSSFSLNLMIHPWHLSRKIFGWIEQENLACNRRWESILWPQAVNASILFTISTIFFVCVTKNTIFYIGSSEVGRNLRCAISYRCPVIFSAPNILMTDFVGVLNATRRLEGSKKFKNSYLEEYITLKKNGDALLVAPSRIFEPFVISCLLEKYI